MNHLPRQRLGLLAPPATGFILPPGDFCRTAAKMGQGGLEPPTPRLSSVCSNQLSYWPQAFGKTPKSLRTNSASPRPDHYSTRHLAGKDAWTAPVPLTRHQARTPSQGQNIFGERWPIPNQPASATQPDIDFAHRLLAYRSHRSLPAETSNPTTASLKGGDPAAGSPTATLLRLHPSR